MLSREAWRWLGMKLSHMFWRHSFHFMPIGRVLSVSRDQAPVRGGPGQVLHSIASKSAPRAACETQRVLHVRAMQPLRLAIRSKLRPTWSMCAKNKQFRCEGKSKAENIDIYATRWRVRPSRFTYTPYSKMASARKGTGESYMRARHQGPSIVVQ